jgi:CubicO group peptidase (beta-lactamase class C family)
MRIIAIILAVVAGACAGCQTSHALKGTIPASEAVGLHDARTERIGEAVRQNMRKEGIPGCSVAVIDHGEVVWAQGFGWIFGDFSGWVGAEREKAFRVKAVGTA